MFFSSRFSMKKCRCTKITWVKTNKNSLKINFKIRQSFPKSLCILETFRMESFIHFLSHQPLCQQSRKKTPNLQEHALIDTHTLPSKNSWLKLLKFNFLHLISQKLVRELGLASLAHVLVEILHRYRKNLKQTSSFPQLWFLDLWQHPMHFVRPDVNSLSRRCVTFCTAEQENKGSYIQLWIEIPHGADLSSIL